MPAPFHQRSTLFDNRNYSLRALERQYQPLHPSQVRTGYSYLLPIPDALHFSFRHFNENSLSSPEQ